MEKPEIKMQFEDSWALEVERAILKHQLKKKDATISKPINPIYLSDNPEENWTYKSLKLKPIYLPDKK